MKGRKGGSGRELLKKKIEKGKGGGECFGV